MSHKISKKDIDDLTNRSIKHLLEEYREISDNFGWHQYLGSEKIGNIANAQALLILQYFKREFSNKHKVISTLKKSQFKSDSSLELHGGWTYQTNHTSSPTTECTCWTLISLQTELDRDDETIVSGLDWLINNHLDCEKDNGWGCIKTDISRTYATCLALRTLQMYGKNQSDAFKRGYSWLKNSKNADGGWGDTERNESTITHTAHAIITLIECGLEKDSCTIKNACSWLLKQYDENEKWIDIQNGGLLELLDFSKNRISYYHYSLPWVLVALMECDQINSSNFFLSFKELKDSEIDGNWNHPYLLNQKYHTIWSKHDSLYAIKRFSQTCPNWDNVKSISLRKNNVSFNYKDSGKNFLNSILNLPIASSNNSEEKINDTNGNKWWLIAIICGIIAIIIYSVLRSNPTWIDEFLIGFGVVIFVLLLNPRRRFYKAFWSTMTILSSLILIPAFDLKAEVNIESFGRFEKFLFNLIVKDPHWAIYLTLGLIAIVCLIIDYFERKK